jgi:hypothetical protein
MANLNWLQTRVTKRVNVRLLVDGFLWVVSLKKSYCLHYWWVCLQKKNFILKYVEMLIVEIRNKTNVGGLPERFFAQSEANRL